MLSFRSSQASSPCVRQISGCGHAVRKGGHAVRKSEGGRDTPGRCPMGYRRACGLFGTITPALTLGFLALSVLSAYGQEPDLSGIYWTKRYNAKVEIVGGGELPFTPAGKKAYDANMAGLKD